MKYRSAIKYFFSSLLIILIISCSENISDSVIPNQAPDTFLFLYPDSGITVSQQKSRLQVHWWGDDPDGLIVGYYFKWEGLDQNWKFTSSNDSLFSLPIGTVDTSFSFSVASVDNGGNGVYDNTVMYNGQNIGPEPFIDRNGNAAYDEGEVYFDIGLIDPTPAVQQFPIKNTAPEVDWDDLTSIPLESFPVMTVGWTAEDLDGDESITTINIGLNDTSSFVSLPGNIRLVTLRSINFETAAPTFQILLNGSTSDIFGTELSNLQLDANNRIYLQAVDISGAQSEVIALPDTSRDWFVKKPKGDLLIVDNFPSGGTARTFYAETFNSLSGGGLTNRYDVFDVENTALPYENVTFLETLKLFDFVFWYSNETPSLDLTNLVTQNYINQGGKIAYSLTFQDSSSSYSYDLATIQNFIPIEKFEQAQPLNFILPGANILKSDQNSTYPNLKTQTTVGFVRTFVPNSASSAKVYDLSSNQINGPIALMDNSNSLFFIGLPLHQCDGNQGNVKLLLEKIFFDEFGLTL
jgi:hypothetical protein